MLSQLPKELIQTFRSLVGEMIPVSQEYDLPGADDERIFKNILIAAQIDLSLVEEGLKVLDAISQTRYRKRFHSLDDQTRRNIVDEFLESPEPYVSAIINGTLQCYYRDDRVMTSLGMEPRSPFPMGYEVKQGDWSLLDSVKKRAKIYRQI